MMVAKKSSLDLKVLENGSLKTKKMSVNLNEKLAAAKPADSLVSQPPASKSRSKSDSVYNSIGLKEVRIKFISLISF